MKGDFSRNTVDLKKNFARVLMQQGRVQLDADWNEQTAILLHYLQTLATDLIGQHGGPENGFEIISPISKENNKLDFTITRGHYYVDGILCENDADVSYSAQPHYPSPDAIEKFGFPFLAYLDVWERHVTAFEDESLREIALGGIDTTTRSQIVWQVKLYKLTTEDAANGCQGIPLKIESNARLIARTQPDSDDGDPCNIEPDSRYRGAENQLYRVEIHTGNINEFGLPQDSLTPTFKWSRENGSVVFPVIRQTEDDKMTKVWLANFGRDEKLDLREGDWVELVDDAYTLQNRAGNLLQITAINRDEMLVTLNGRLNISIGDSSVHPLLRRWDQRAGNPQEGGLTLNDNTAANAQDSAADNAAKIIEGEWLTLEDGVQIFFQPLFTADSNTQNSPGKFDRATTASYRTGDYWLIPARTATGDVEWTKDAAQAPHGVEHHYAPLGIFTDNEAFTSCRCSFRSISNCPPATDAPKPAVNSTKPKGKTPS